MKVRALAANFQNSANAQNTGSVAKPISTGNIAALTAKLASATVNPRSNMGYLVVSAPSTLASRASLPTSTPASTPTPVVDDEFDFNDVLTRERRKAVMVTQVKANAVAEPIVQLTQPITVTQEVVPVSVSQETSDKANAVAEPIVQLTQPIMVTQEVVPVSVSQETSDKAKAKDKISTNGVDQNNVTRVIVE